LVLLRLTVFFESSAGDKAEIGGIPLWGGERISGREGRRVFWVFDQRLGWRGGELRALVEHVERIQVRVLLTAAHVGVTVQDFLALDLLFKLFVS